MSDFNDAGSSTPDAFSMEGVEGQTNEASALQEELFELIEGKNPDGTPIKKSLTKAEMLQLAQKGFGADKSFEEAKATKEQMKQLARAMRDPSQLPLVLQHLGVDFDSFMQERMAQMMLENMKSPEEKEMEALRKEAEEFRRLKAQQMKEQEEAELHSTAERMQRELYGRIEETLNTAGVPKTAQTVGEIARYIQNQMNATLRRGETFHLDQIKPQNIVAHMKKLHADNFTSLFSELDEDGILAMLPDTLQKKIANALTKKMSGGKVQDINTIKRESKPSWGDEPVKKTKYIDTTEANERIADKIAKAQALWDRQHNR